VVKGHRGAVEPDLAAVLDHLQGLMKCGVPYTLKM
jgi:hypothetical protein